MEIKNLNKDEKWNAIFEKCYQDEAFKKEFMANPVDVLQSYSDVEIDTKGFKVVVTDQSDPQVININIPINEDDLQLTEAQLEHVAGGSKFCISVSFFF
ncbi:MAG: hypothetical protein MK202_12455 [Tenacibaculum sp.]|nr:hypothetical protein [Tenacibaculum sp.]